MEKTHSKIELSAYICGAVLLISAVILIFSIFKDYGISWDEPLQRNLGAANIKYLVEIFTNNKNIEILKNAPVLSTYQDRQYGPAFEAPLFALEFFLGETDSRKIYLMRHLCNAFIFLAGVIALFHISLTRFQDMKIALLTALMYLISPRFFSEAFYNSKDIIFATIFIFCTLTLINLLKKGNYRNLIVHAIFSSILIDIRIMGLMIPFLTVAAMLLVEKKSTNEKFGRTLKYCTVYFIAVIVFTISFFPFLWSDPLSNFYVAFSRMAHFDWDGYNLFLGNLVHAYKLSWQYIPVWIFFTTPPLYLLLFIAGLRSIVLTFYSAQSRFTYLRSLSNVEDLIFLGCFLIPILAVIILGSTLYNGWRQLYFVYPFLILISVGGLNSILRITSKKWIKYFVWAACILQLSFTTHWMVKHHPFQYLYFNDLYRLININESNSLDLDYWGVTTLNALQYILKNDDSVTIDILSEQGYNPVNNNILMLQNSERSRIRVIQTPSDHFYLIRLNQTPSSSSKLVEQYLQKEGGIKQHELILDGAPIYTIYKNRKVQ